MHKHEWQSEKEVYIHNRDSGLYSCFKRYCACGAKAVLYLWDMEDGGAEETIIPETEYDSLKVDTRW